MSRQTQSSYPCRLAVHVQINAQGILEANVGSQHLWTASRQVADPLWVHSWLSCPSASFRQIRLSDILRSSSEDPACARCGESIQGARIQQDGLIYHFGCVDDARQWYEVAGSRSRSRSPRPSPPVDVVAHSPTPMAVAQHGMVTVTLQYWAECRVPVSDVASVNASGEFAIVLRKGSRSSSEKVLK